MKLSLTNVLMMNSFLPKWESPNTFTWDWTFRTLYCYRSIPEINRPQVERLYRTQLLFKSLDIYAAYPPNTHKFDTQKYLAEDTAEDRSQDDFMGVKFVGIKWRIKTSYKYLSDVQQ